MAAGRGLERLCRADAGWIHAAPPGCGVERIEAYFPGHAYDLHRHDTYALGLTLSGVQRFDYRGSVRDSPAGHAIVLHPDEAHNGRAADAAGFRYRMLYVAPSRIRAALGDRARALPFLREPVSADARLVAALRLALGDMREDLAEDEALLAVADALLARDVSAARGAGVAGVASGVERARDYLEARFAAPVASVASERVTGLDRFVLARQFRARFGTSPSRYLTMRRLDAVRRAILGGEGLAEASAAAGFADQSHMTRQFRRAFGLPPGKWRDMQA